MKMYTLLEASIKLGVCKTSVYLKCKAKNIGLKKRIGNIEIILLSEKDIESLVFRAKNKKRYIYNLHRKKQTYKNICALK